MEESRGNRQFNHKSVMLHETLEGLNLREGGIYVDGTIGGGGHAYEICRRIKNNGLLIGIDQDEDAVRAAGERLKEFGSRVVIRRSNYCNLQNTLLELGIDAVDGILLDLGVSSHQLDTPERGFSYMHDAPLDMRMDNRSELTACDIVNDYSEEELYRVIKCYGEDNFAGRIARKIVSEREKKKIETTLQLAEIIKAAVPARFHANGHPAKRTFQAIRIELNRELEVLEETLDFMMSVLKPGGRLCVITFHSLEDRIVKSKFVTAERPCTCPPSFPVCICGKKPIGKVITRKPITASGQETEENKRSKSAKLRVFEKL